MTALIQIFIIAVSLALDAFSVSVASGIKSQKAQISKGLTLAFFFGAFQALMPLLGWYLGILIENFIASYSHWIAFVLLFLIGIKMIKESFDDTSEKEKLQIFELKTLLLLSIATSIDAFIVGISLAVINIPLFISVAIIGIMTFILCFLGFLFGKKLGSFFEGKVEVIGGIALIAIGLKILLEGIL